MKQLPEWGLSDISTFDLQQDFREVGRLGADLPIVLTAKAEAGGSYRRARYKRQRETIRAGKVFKEMRKSLPGFIRFGTLASLLAGNNSHALNLEGIEPYDFESRGKQGIFVLHDDTRIRIVDLETGDLIDTLTEVFYRGKKMELYNVHTVVQHPHDPDLLLISVTGLDRVLEVKLSTREVTWEWCPWHHGLHTNGHGLTIMDRGDAFPEFPEGYETHLLDRTEAEQMVNRDEKPLPGEACVLEVDLSGLPARLGLEKWERVKLINSAFYSPDGKEVMITFWQTGEAICANKEKGSFRWVATELGGCPHSLLPVGDSYYLTDTSAGRVLCFDNELRPLHSVDFTACPLPEGAEADSPEWLQNTHPLNEELLATIDFRRSRVVVWNPLLRVYSNYFVSDEWVLQSLKAIHPSSLAALGLKQVPMLEKG